MFTPQRKGWAAGLSLTPARAGGTEGSAPASRRGSVLGREKGKGVLGAEVTPIPPPPLGSLGDGRGGLGEGGEDVEAWERFRQEGLLDETGLLRKERDALRTTVSELQAELHEYQYNMGLLLIEKKDWTCKFDEINERLAETEEILKREQTSHLIAIAEVEKREENLRNALGVEKQCVADLEKALREMRAQTAEVKFTSDRKLVEAHALEASLEERSLEVEQKLHAADAKLAEASRKSSEIERKLEEVEARERKIQRDYMSLDNERKAYEKDIAKQREHLRDWEKNLQERQKRLVDEQCSLNEREHRANEADQDLRKKEGELAEARKKLEFFSSSLEEKDNDINSRFRALTTKEKEVNIKQMNLEQKERDLLALEEKLNARETVEIQKLIDDHKALLDSKKQEFDLEMENKRKSFDEEIKNKLEEMKKKEHEINLKEEQVFKREQALESKKDSLKDKEKEIDTKCKKLKEMEKTIKNEEMKLDEENKKLGKETQALVASKTQLESLKAKIEAEKDQILRDMESLKLTQEERDQHFQLQLKLKDEIEDCGLMKKSLEKQIEDLKSEKERFESEWEELDEKRSVLNAEVKHYTDEREKFEKWRHNEEERLRKERLDSRADVERELAELNQKKEAFEKLKAHELAEVHEELERGRADIAAEIERREHELNIRLQRKEKEAMEKLQEEISGFNTKRDADLTNIRASANLNDVRSHKLKVEEDRLEREKEELSMHRKRLETDQSEIQKDIDALRVLSGNLKDQREEFIKERDCFFSVAEQCKVCKNCGVTISELELVGLQVSRGIEDAGNLLLPSLADGYLEDCIKGKNAETTPQVTTGHRSGGSGGRMSWLQKCSKIFHFSPAKKSESSSEAKEQHSMLFTTQLDQDTSDVEVDNRTSLPLFVANDSFDTQRVAQSDGMFRANEESVRCDGVDEQEPSFGVADNGMKEIEAEHVGPSNFEQIERAVSSLPVADDSQPEPSQNKKCQPGRKGKSRTLRRNRSVKAVVEDAKAFLGEASEGGDRQLNGDGKTSMNTRDESEGDSIHTNQMQASSRQNKRPADTSMTTSDLDAEDSDVRSGSVSVGGRRKRRHISTAPGTQTSIPGERRYNFRRSTIAGTVGAVQAVPDQYKGRKTGHRQTDESKMVKGDVVEDGEGSSRAAPTDEPSYACSGENKTTYSQQKTTVVETVVEAEISSQNIIQSVRKEVEVVTNDYINKKSEISVESVDGEDEVNGTELEAATPATPSDRDSGSDDDGSDEDDEKLNASIGKKLWTFFTT
ncbi:Tropomyosin protein [Dioscorea alata]|uniref:Tropomyosin protein n=1 Tax=Dioscorea alata TaxID=55571 RepID=A0ACB7W5I8_DIOAL|nr:Tropomyosin protein [Dioscorea alata]